MLNNEELAPYLDLLKASARSALNIQREDGSFPPGRNNKWNDTDTPARTTAHFAIQLCFAYRLTKDRTFLDAAVDCGKFLKSEYLRPGGYTFLCRISSEKDLCNGLIGQAWVMEALIHLFQTTQDQSYFELAKDVYGIHPFSNAYGLYHAIDCDGKNRGVAKTLNHQLIFAAMGMGLLSLGATEFRDDLSTFFRKLPLNMHLDQEGLIHHHVNKGRNTLERLIFNTVRYFQRMKLKERSKGYHSFNMYGLALAKRFLPDFSAWNDPLLARRLSSISEYAASEDYISEIESNPYALAFRLTAQEILLFSRQFSHPSATRDLYKIIKTQFNNHWDDDKKLLCRNTSDPSTLSSRLYEMWYLFEDEISHTTHQRN